MRHAIEVILILVAVGSVWAVIEFWPMLRQESRTTHVSWKELLVWTAILATALALKFAFG
jgi:hypothetical protein